MALPNGITNKLGRVHVDENELRRLYEKTNAEIRRLAEKQQLLGTEKDPFKDWNEMKKARFVSYWAHNGSFRLILNGTLLPEEVGEFALVKQLLKDQITIQQFNKMKRRLKR